MKSMKREILSTALAMAALAACAQYSNEYTPTSGWPYLFEDFKPAIVYYNNNKPESAKVNVHLMNNELHFTDGEKIMIVHDAQRIDSVVCEDNTVLLRKINLYIRQTGKTERVVIGRTCEGDLHAFDDSNGAYGMQTSTGATQRVASFSDHGNMAALRYREMIDNRHDTSVLPTTKKTIFIIDDRIVCHATKNGINKILDKEQKKAFKGFLKANKVDWKKVDDLLLTAQFLESIISKEDY